ncbi:MAG TPA: type II toxin-antitoxin system RelE/ParE family toxin [Kiritimatiellia bacterium]|nr:type II toxin-antitoxin system RelE/ParE family toxin [Kiritimatiellia bacterium]
MIRQLIVRPEAEAEMTHAFDWYDERQPGLGAEFLLCLDALFASVLRAPRRYPRIYGSVRHGMTRRFPYKVLFVEENERVVILAVFHVRRNPDVWQQRS